MVWSVRKAVAADFHFQALKLWCYLELSRMFGNALCDKRTALGFGSAVSAMI